MSSELSHMNTATNQLSDYQRAVLNELGISCWKKQGDDNVAVSTTSEKEAKHQTSVLHTPRTETSSKEAALSKLQQLKTQQSSVSYAGKVLCEFTPSVDYSRLVKDVMTALELSDCPLVALTQAELAQAKDYALVWQFGDTVGLESKQLTTPQLSQFNDPALKKQLWRLIHSQLIK
ncbi:hypothetical protein AX660_18780 [Paraglaciecola hydrolytica]|uniref:Uncharacterized protein n=2 Tax=Paraglaciecola hydrolytica TaxID=1799789 RepID=A0A148KMZ0_9ALTE|nr:hypothetical protein AX660_18780 [Paraglaciecola hydrolytica]